jgi:hypothetical protein
VPRFRAFPGFKAGIHGAKLVAHGEVQPTPLSETYRVKIEYEVADFPRVWVLSPELRPSEGESRIPHMYGQERLCLYLPGTGEWSRNLSLAHTVIPWIALWLHYYELWHATGEWLGGGVEPPQNKPYLREME